MAGKAAPGQANTAAKKAEVENRRREVSGHLLAGRSVRDIAALLDVSPATIVGDAKAVRAEWRKQYALTYDEHVEQEAARLDVAVGAIWKHVEWGSFDAIDRLVKLSSAKRDLLGLDAPKRVQQRVEVTERVSPEDLDSRLSRLAAALEAAEDPGGTDAG